MVFLRYTREKKLFLLFFLFLRAGAALRGVLILPRHASGREDQNNWPYWKIRRRGEVIWRSLIHWNPRLDDRRRPRGATLSSSCVYFGQLDQGIWSIWSACKRACSSWLYGQPPFLALLQSRPPDQPATHRSSHIQSADFLKTNSIHDGLKNYMYKMENSISAIACPSFIDTKALN